MEFFLLYPNKTIPSFYKILEIVLYSQVLPGKQMAPQYSNKPGFYADRRMHTIPFDSSLSVVNVTIETRCEMGTTRWKKSAGSWIGRYFKVHSSHKYCTYENKIKNNDLILENTLTFQNTVKLISSFLCQIVYITYCTIILLSFLKYPLLLLTF